MAKNAATKAPRSKRWIPPLTLGDEESFLFKWLYWLTTVFIDKSFCTRTLMLYVDKIYEGIKHFRGILCYNSIAIFWHCEKTSAPNFSGSILKSKWLMVPSVCLHESFRKTLRIYSETVGKTETHDMRLKLSSTSHLENWSWMVTSFFIFCWQHYKWVCSL